MRGPKSIGISAAALGTQAAPTGPPPQAAAGGAVWVAGSNADFQANGPATIIVNGSQTVGNITFYGTGYTLDTSTTGAGTLILGGATPTITTNAASATINSLLTGTNGLTIAGNGTLTLTNTNNNYTGGTTVNSGTLTLNPFNQYNTYGYGIIKGPLTINPGAMVYIENYWSLGYNPGQCVTSITINNGTLNNGAKGMGPQTITMSGGTISGTTAWYTFDTPATLNTIGGGTLALISALMSINVSNLTFNVAQGSVPGGIDLLDSGGINYCMAHRNKSATLVLTQTAYDCIVCRHDSRRILDV